MSAEAMELISQMEKATTLDEAVTLQRKALALSMRVHPLSDVSIEEMKRAAKEGAAVSRAGQALMKRMMAAHR